MGWISGGEGGGGAFLNGMGKLYMDIPPFAIWIVGVSRAFVSSSGTRCALAFVAEWELWTALS